MEGTSKSRKPEDTPFKQQRLKSWQPILTPVWVIGTFAVVGLLFLPIGILLHVESNNVSELSQLYDSVELGNSGCALASEADGNQFDAAHQCEVTFRLTEDMAAPVYVYYQLDNFYQNHRRYVQSRSDAQLRGQVFAQPPSDCEPMQTEAPAQIFTGDNTAAAVTPTANERTLNLNPCGLIANSLFNDIFWLARIKTADGTVTSHPALFDGKTVNNVMSQNDIAWQSDVDTKFKNIPADQRTDNELYLWQNQKYRSIIPQFVGQEPIENVTAWTEPATAFGVQDQHFIVWMRTAGLPNFRKLYGRIDSDLKKGTELTFLVSSNFVVQTFDGKKYLVLSTTSWFGGRNPFLGIAYITVGALCILLALLFFAKHKLSPRKLGDTRYLVWKNNQ